MGSRLRSQEARRKGIAIVLTALMLVFVIPIVGLAIDAGVLYSVKSKLQMSVDAGAIAAARSLNKGLTIMEQESNARARAEAFFNANYPDGTMATKNKEVTTSVAESGYRRRTVEVTGRVEAPTYFMRVFGYTFTPVAATGTASRRDVNIIMVMDRSGSMSTSGSCEPMKAAAKDFVELFANGRDRIGMITYSTSYFQAFPHTMDFLSTTPNINTRIDSISCAGFTNSATAVSEAYNHLVNINEPGVLNIIMFFTDGIPTALTASFPIKKLQDTRYGYGPNSSSITRPRGNYISSTVYEREQFPNTGTLYNNVPPSPCRTTVSGTNHWWWRVGSSTTYLQSSPNPAWNPANKVGVLKGGGGSSTGNTTGLYAPLATSMSASDGPVLGSSTDCRFTADQNYVRRDIAFIPNIDNYGNATRGFGPVDEFPSGHAYAGSIRPDTPISLLKAAKNATYNAAVRIRGDSILDPVFYIVGLGNPSDPDPFSQPDTDLLLRMSNDPTSPEYTDLQNAGMFIFAPDNSQLNSAFVRVASEILRIAN